MRCDKSHTGAGCLVSHNGAMAELLISTILAAPFAWAFGAYLFGGGGSDHQGRPTDSELGGGE